MSALGRLAHAHAREAFRSIVGVILIGGRSRILVPGRIRVVGVVGGGIRVIIVNILVRRSIIGVVGLLIRLLTCVWIVVGHSRHCRRIPRQKWGQSLESQPHEHSLDLIALEPDLLSWVTLSWVTWEIVLGPSFYCSSVLEMVPHFVGRSLPTKPRRWSYFGVLAVTQTPSRRRIILFRLGLHSPLGAHEIRRRRRQDDVWSRWNLQPRCRG